MSLSIDLFLSPDIKQKYLDEHFLVVICIIVGTRVPHVGWVPLPLGNSLQTLVDKCVLLFGLHHAGSGFPHPVDEVEQVHRVKFVNSLKNSQTSYSKWLSSMYYLGMDTNEYILFVYMIFVLCLSDLGHENLRWDEPTVKGFSRWYGDILS